MIFCILLFNGILKPAFSCQLINKSMKQKYESFNVALWLHDRTAVIPSIKQIDYV